MARALTVVLLCVCVGLSLAADLRKLIEERASLTPRAGATQGGVAGKNAGDLDTANSWGWGGWGGPFGGPFGPWGYGYGWGYPGGFYGGYGWW